METNQATNTTTTSEITAAVDIAPNTENAATEQSTVEGAADNDSITAAVNEPAKPEVKKTPWFMNEITALRAKNRELEAKAAQVPAADSTEGAITVTPQELERLTAAKAAQRAFNDKCNNVFFEGKSEFNDFADAVQTLEAAGLTKPEFIDVVTELPNSHRILYELAKDPDEAMRISRLPVAKQALELARMETRIATSPAPQTNTVSKAPAPIKPLDGKSGNKGAYGTKFYPGMPHEEYRAWRNNQNKKG